MTADEFRAAFATADRTSCWIWPRSVLASGYGQVRFAGKPSRAHRVAYELHVGPIPAGLVLDHLCGVKLCVNPAHLEPVTQAENLRRARVHRVMPTKIEPGGADPRGGILRPVEVAS